MNTTNRRRFLSGAIATAASYSRILGANDRIQVGAIGTGSRGQYLLSVLNRVGSNDIVAVCDVYEPRRLQAQGKFSPKAHDYLAYRDILDRNDIDAVVIATPDHWHVPLILDAVKAGKDVYCEKPVTHISPLPRLMLNFSRMTSRSLSALWPSGVRMAVTPGA